MAQREGQGSSMPARREGGGAPAMLRDDPFEFMRRFAEQMDRLFED